MYLVIKIIGCILLVSATTLMGFKKAQRLYKRRDFINDFLVFLDTLATNIRYSMNFRLFFPKAKTDSEKQYTVRTKNTTVHFLRNGKMR